MKGILADVNCDGHLKNLLLVWVRPEWHGLWQPLQLQCFFFEDFGISRAAQDDDVWRFCQRESLVLLTGNRNRDGEQSLDAVIVRETSTITLPVFTIGSMQRISTDRIYLETVVIHLLEYLIDLKEKPETLVGAGRIFLPKNAAAGN